MIRKHEYFAFFIYRLPKRNYVFRAWRQHKYVGYSKNNYFTKERSVNCWIVTKQGLKQI